MSVEIPVWATGSASAHSRQQTETLCRPPRSLLAACVSQQEVLPGEVAFASGQRRHAGAARKLVASRRRGGPYLDYLIERPAAWAGEELGRLALTHLDRPQARSGSRAGLDEPGHALLMTWAKLRPNTHWTWWGRFYITDHEARPGGFPSPDTPPPDQKPELRQWLVRIPSAYPAWDAIRQIGVSEVTILLVASGESTAITSGLTTLSGTAPAQRRCMAMRGCSRIH